MPPLAVPMPRASKPWKSIASAIPRRPAGGFPCPTATKPTGVAEAFFDSNVILYLISGDVEKAARSEALVAEGGVISVQVLNEFTSVALRKYGLPWSRIRGALDPIRYARRVEVAVFETHDRAASLAERWTALASTTPSPSPPPWSPVARSSIPKTCRNGQVIDGQLDDPQPLPLRPTRLRALRARIDPRPHQLAEPRLCPRRGNAALARIPGPADQVVLGHVVMQLAPWTCRRCGRDP